MAKTDSQQASSARAPETTGFIILKWSVYIMGVLLVIGTIVFAYAVYQKASGLKRPVPIGQNLPDIAVPAGYQIKSISVDQGRLAVHYHGPASDLVIFYDAATGVESSRVKLVK